MKTESQKLPERLEVGTHLSTNWLYDGPDPVARCEQDEHGNALAADLAHRYNCYEELVKALLTVLDSNIVIIEAPRIAQRCREALTVARAERKA